jgi:hypothetical protein
MKPRIKVLTLGVDDLDRSFAFSRDGMGLNAFSSVVTPNHHTCDNALHRFNGRLGGFLFAWREVRRELLARLRGRSSIRDRANVGGANHVRCERTFVELRDEFRARRPNDEQGQDEQSDPRHRRKASAGVKAFLGGSAVSDNPLLERVAAVAEDSHLTLEFASGQLVLRMNVRSPCPAHKRSDNSGSGMISEKDRIIQYQRAISETSIS